MGFVRHRQTTVDSIPIAACAHPTTRRSRPSPVVRAGCARARAPRRSRAKLLYGDCHDHQYHRRAFGTLSTAGRETLYEHPRTGAMTDPVEIVRRDRLEPTTADAALGLGAREPGPDGKPRLVAKARSKRAAVALPAPSRMFDDGGGAGAGPARASRHARDHGAAGARGVALAPGRRGDLACAVGA